MPSVQNATAEAPVKLAKVEVSPGVVLKLSPKDAEAYAAREAAETKRQADYTALLRGVPEVSAPAAPAEVPLTVLTRAELVDLATARGLSSSGNKSAIAARFAEGTDDATDDADDGDDGAGSDEGAELGAPAGAAPDATPATPATD